jgi:tetratricopeptide (TPR) repeat protein
MTKTTDSLKNMSRTELLNLPTGAFSDYDFVNLAQYFSEEHKDRDREVAVLELALRSPMVDEMVDYAQLYEDVVGYYEWKGKNEIAMRWAVAYVAFIAQHDRDNFWAAWRELGSTYITVGQPEVGLGIFTHLVERDPDDIWNYNSMGMVLSQVKLNRLAVEVIGHGLEIIAKNDPERLRSQFKKFIKEAQTELAKGVDETNHISAGVLQALRAAMSLPVESDFDEDAEIEYLAPVVDLLDWDEEEGEDRYQEVLNFGKVLIPELIYLGLDREWINDSAGPLHAAHLLNRLRAEQVPELDGLASWLDHLPATGERLRLGSSIGKIGGHTLEELDAIARNSDFDVRLRDMAVEEMVERVEQEKGLRAGVVEMVRGLLNRQGADQAQEEVFTGYLIGSALDLKARELLPDMERAFAEDRVDRKIIDEYSLYHELDLPIPPMPERRSDGLYLQLECKACGRVREHFTHFVIWNILGNDDNPGQRSPYILDHEVVCPKCGAVDQYELPSIEMVKLMNLNVEQIADMVSKKSMKTPPKYDPRVYTLRGTAMGKTMHVLDGLGEYHKRIAAQPDNAGLHMRLGNLLRTIGRYPAALEEYRKAVALDGGDPDILFPAASAEQDFGDTGAAKQLYERIIKSKPVTLHTLSQGLNELAVAALQGLEAMRQGEISPWAYQVTNMQGALLLPPRYRGMEKSEKPEKKNKHATRHGKRR